MAATAGSKIVKLAVKGQSERDWLEVDGADGMCIAMSMIETSDQVTVRLLNGTPIMLMRNPDSQIYAEQDIDSHRKVHSPREMLFGQIALLLLFSIAILLRSLSG